MPRVTDVVTSDSDADKPRATLKKDHSSKKNRVSSEPEPASENEEDEVAPGEENGEQEEEYEIEDVIDSLKGYFGDGKTGYFVKWKGYPPEDNSWVHEDDAANAQDLIKKYWENKRKASKGGPRKSTDPAKTKSGRKSIAAEEPREPTPPAKKRSRPKKAEQEQSEKEQEASSDADDARAKKKPRKSQGASAKKVNIQLAEDEEMVSFGSMKKHMTIASWENLVETVDTIERGEDGNLFVYFKIKHSDDRMREVSRLCAQKFPQKLIKFYESNLRWRIDGEEAN
ncbi:uncharacterized protein EDB91DRAFT_1137250 [Suillus paluster]|uniref:uncharacterized protein n=1 Tax=Suillus paluster TaxID=48578 RepID=UPI001B8637C5|nr:uncharacterized protein EDB91DRAFT_1137250 [Suillus paluster]KAG1738898.1 hypothetical protein EDB91DRAFT_1137250 [Suillus paluster]